MILIVNEPITNWISDYTYYYFIYLFLYKDSPRISDNFLNILKDMKAGENLIIK